MTIEEVPDIPPAAPELGETPAVARSRRVNVRIFASVFVGLVCLSILILHISFAWNVRVKDLDDAQISTANLSRALAEHAQATLISADSVLFGMVQRLEVEGMDRDSLARLYPLLASYVKELPQIQGLFVYDQSGKWMVNSMDDSPWMLNNADREYFIYHMTHEDRNPHVGEPVKSRSSGDWIIPLSRRINHPDGSFAGVVLASVEVEYFLKFYRSFDIGKHGEILLATQPGILLAKWPASGEIIGKNISNSNIVSDHASRNRNGIAIITGADGVKRLHSYKRLEKYPLFVTAALSYDEVLASWRTETLMQSVGVLILVAMLAWMGKRLINQIKLRAQAQQKLLSAREKLVEMNKTLQKMALEDGLTGVANRRQFDVTLANEFNRAKRDFKITPEPPPEPVARRSGKTLSYFIQRHHARALHYDFRLEVNGVLKSWAVPKGPSLDPHDKRLAVHVEDHPYDYGSFEGRIPAHQYGAGEVVLWDRGEWLPIGDPVAGLKKGHLEFELRGAKLSGRWNLVRMGKPADKDKDKDDKTKENWLLIKEKDDAAREGKQADITALRPESVAGTATKKTGIAPGNAAEKPVETTSKKRKPAGRAATSMPMPDKVDAQLAMLVKEAPDGDAWLSEMKFDGYRGLCRIEGGKARIFTREHLDWSKRWPQLTQALAAL
ncbi:DNA polymerase ligase N-terminal domain-containing protein, partial [Herbaspirillum lusitanum]|uniref:DNA polymerase ligase N-terminal domain-containing protein n=1 Tax=Herbaspirillum lusitanum TaxID=213312 RepID=UPI000A00CF2E